MSTDSPNPEIKSALLVAQVSYEEAVKIEDLEGKRVLRFRVPPSMQGHTFEVDVTEPSASSEPIGPSRIEYVLGTEFVIHEAEVPSSTFEVGYSHLAMAPEFERCEVSLSYSNRKAPGYPRTPFWPSREPVASCKDSLLRLKRWNSPGLCI
jgi:hypothetical protein